MPTLDNKKSAINPEDSGRAFDFVEQSEAQQQSVMEAAAKHVSAFVGQHNEAQLKKASLRESRAALEPVLVESAEGSYPLVENTSPRVNVRGASVTLPSSGKLGANQRIPAEERWAAQQSAEAIRDLPKNLPAIEEKLHPKPKNMGDEPFEHVKASWQQRASTEGKDSPYGGRA